jgi:hypothetical protein
MSSKNVKPLPLGGVWLIAILGVMLFRLPSTFAQTPGLTVSNGIAGLSWPQNAYYYLLQSSTNLTASNSWFNVATASPLSAQYSFSIPPQTVATTPASVITNLIGGSFVVTRTISNAQQFFRLRAPQKPQGIQVCSFAVFYDGELEFSDSAASIFTGAIHANGPIDFGSPATQTFNSTITTASLIDSPSRAGVVFNSWTNTVIFNGQPPYVTNTPAFSPVFGTNNPHVIIEMPPTGEDPTSSLGQSRLFNQTQVILIVTNSPSYITSGANPAVSLTLQNSYNGNIPATDPAKVIYYLTNVTTTVLRTNLNNSTEIAMPFLSLTNTFTDQREDQTNMYVTQIDVGAFRNWALTNPIVTGKMPAGSGLYPTTLYVADERNIGTNKLSVVRLVNGQQLPNNNGLGFTVATQNPLYTLGNYNTTQNGTNFSLAIGSTTNGYTVPAALIADAITVLSSNWSDSLSSGSFTARTTFNTTLNAAIVTGNVPSTGTSTTTFSGGVENLTRLLENWSGSVLVYNTSLVCLYSSQMATNQFQLSGNYEEAPTRDWGFDPNFNNPDKLPPGVPSYTLP